MRNSSFFEKLTGSLRLSDDDLNALSDQDDSKDKKSRSNTKTTNEEEYEEVIEEVDDDSFEIPDDEEIETIEEVIEDDSIDHEEIEEYYEEIIDEEDENEPKISIYGENDDYDEDVIEEHTSDIEDKNTSGYDNENDEIVESQEEEEKEKIISINSSRTIELPIDVFEMHNEVVLRILVPGITPENLKVSITKDRVSLSCTRPAPDGIKDSSYFEREIPYGDFNRMIQLPADVEVEKAEAVEKYGLLIIRLPKLDTKKVQELKIKSV